MINSAPTKKTAEETLEKNLRDAADYRFALEEACFVATTDANGIVVYANDNFCKISQFSREELIGTDYRPKASAYLVKDTMDKIWKVLAAGKTWKGALRNKAKDGTDYWMETTIVPFLDADGTPYKYVAVGTDITKRKEAEELVRQNERRFRAMIENSLDAIVLTRQSGEIFYISPSITKVFGYSINDIGGTFTFSLIHPDDLAGFMVERKKMLQIPGTSFYYQLRLKHKNDNWIWCEFTITNMLHETGINAIIANFRDISEKRLIEKQREFNQKNLTALINNTNDLLWSVNRDFKFITCNKPFIDMVLVIFGTTITKGSDALSILPSAEQFAKYKKLYERAFAGETFTETVSTARVLNMFAEVSFYPIWEGDEVIGTACYSHDITERIKKEENLCKSEKRLKESQRIAQVGSWQMDLETNIATWSEEHCRIFGVAPEDNRQTLEAWKSFVHPDDLDSILQTVTGNRILSKGADLNYRIVLKDGSIKFINAKGKFEFDENGTPIALIGTSHDITELKEIEQQLTKSEVFNRSVLNSLSSHIAVLDSSGTIVAVNDAWRKFARQNGDTNLQHTSEGINYLTVCEKSAVSGDVLAIEVLRGVKEVLSGTQTVFYLEYPCHSAAKQQWFSLKILKFDNNHESMIVMAHHDISKRKLAELERINMTLDLIQRNKDLEQFSYMVSHNLRAPIANILGASNILNNNGINAEQRSFLSHGLNESVKKLDEVVSDLNHILQVKKKGDDIKETVLFSTLVNDIKLSIHNLIAGQTLRIEVDFDSIDSFFTIKGYLYSIFYNLISNSIKYRQPQIEGIIKIKSYETRNKIVLVFADNGMGIDMEKRGDQVFGLYKRFHKDIEGKGMGLFMVKAQVEMLGGKISIESEVNKGTIFKIEFEK